MTIADITEPLFAERARRAHLWRWAGVCFAIVVAVFVGLGVRQLGTLDNILNRRSPVLEYLSCHDKRSDALFHDLRLSIDGPLTPKLQQQIDRDDDRLQVSTQVGKPGACTSLPK